MNFDESIDRRSTHSEKWDSMETLYGVSANDGIPMWIADMDFRPPQVVQDALSNMLAHGVYGYFGDQNDYLSSIQWWMKHRHGWNVPRSGIFTTHGLVNGTAMCIDTFTDPGDGVILFTPVYHSFAKVIVANNRQVLEMELVNNNGRYEMDFETYDTIIPTNAKMVVLCSPHNPGGRVWSRDELEQLAAFVRRHDLILVSDEIHHDLTFDIKHTPMALIEGIKDRLIMMTATTKTFNIAGGHVGNVIIESPDLRDRFAKRMTALGLSPNAFGLHMATAAYSDGGAAWLDALVKYLDGNRKLFDAGINAIPGLKSMQLEATFLAWVDFSRTGMTKEDFTARIENSAKIAVNHGPTFGSGGEKFLRFNIGTTRANIELAVTKIQAAFKDLQ
jgi:cystathionine beta-lyase